MGARGTGTYVRATTTMHAWARDRVVHVRTSKYIPAGRGVPCMHVSMHGQLARCMDRPTEKRELNEACASVLGKLVAIASRVDTTVCK
jgi:hypothetical protein